MNRLKMVFFAAGGLVVLLALAATLLVLFVDVNAHKPRLEAAASAALGMDVRIAGPLGIGFLPGFHAALEDVRIRNRGSDVASAKDVRLGIALLPLLRKEVRIGHVGLRGVRIFIERDRSGKYNFETVGEEPPRKPPGETGPALPGMAVGTISLRDGSFLYRNRMSGEELRADGVDFDVDRLRLPEGKSPDLPKAVSFAAELSCRELRTDNLVLSGLKAAIRAKDGVFDVEPATMRIFGGDGSGSLQADISGPAPLYRIRYSLPRFSVGEFLKAVSPKTAAEGAMGFSAKLSLRGKTAAELKRSAEGEASLGGENLTLDGIDIDRILSRYESSQTFNLVDVGAFFFAGPFGPALTKGYDFANIFRGTQGRSRIRKLVSDWRVERGVAHARDVALATEANRIALKGRLDFVNERFDDVTVALVDGKGCATLQQKIRGPFRKPDVEKVSVLRSLAGPVLTLFRKTTELVAGRECEVFYAGSVAHPN